MPNQLLTTQCKVSEQLQATNKLTSFKNKQN